MESGSGYHRPEDVDRAAGGAEVECSRQQHGTHVECQWHYGEEIALIVLTDLRDVFFTSGRRRTRYWRDWSSDVCSSDLYIAGRAPRLTSLARPAARVPRRPSTNFDAVVASTGKMKASAKTKAVWSHQERVNRRKPARRSEERRVGKEGRSRWSPYH